jgi:hypothetical protein
LAGNGTNAVNLIAPGTTGNVLVSDGTSWSSGTGSASFIQNQTAGDQTAGFRISGNGLIGGNVGIGNASPSYKLHIGSGNGDGILIGNYNDQLGWNGTGNAPEYSIRFAGYRDVVGSFNGAKIAAVRTNICCSGLSQGVELSFQTQETVAGVSGDGNLVERLRIGNGGNVKINNLAGSGNRAVYADANGFLVASGKNMTYLEDRNERSYDNSNIGYRDASVETSNLFVNSGNVVTINFSGKFKFTGGSNNDDVRFRILVTGDCGNIALQEVYEYEDFDNARDEYMPVGGNFIYVPSCSGNIKFKVQLDANSDADDNYKVGDIVLVAVKY